MKALTAELQLLAAIRASQAAFCDQLIAAAREHRAANPVDGRTVLDAEEVRQLRSDGTAQLAEFFFSIEEMGLGEPVALRAYLNRHNDALQAKLNELRRDGEAYTPNGLSRDRIAGGLLEAAQIDHLIEEAEDGRLRFDQGNLACLLVDAMSAESCRKLVLVLANCGFLRRIGRNNVRIRSEGKLETLYRAHLSAILDQISNREHTSWVA
jgi:hypothetical protein